MKYEVDEDKLWFCERKGYHETYKSWTKDEIRDWHKKVFDND